MYRTTKLLVLPVALASLALWSAGAAPAPASTNAPAADKPALKAADLFPDTVVAKGKGIEIKRSLLDEEVRRFKSSQAASGQPLRADDTEIERYVLNQLIGVKLLAAKATDTEKAAARSKAEKRFAELQSRLGDETVNREMKLLGTTREELLAKWAELGAFDAAAKRGLKIDISDAEVKQYFDDNQAKFEQPEMVVASHILLATRDLATREELPADKKAAKHKQAEELLKRVRAGEDFAKLAKENSEDSGSAKRGGEYQFARGGQMVKEFEEAAFALNTNQVSEIVTTPYGYHIIKLSEKIPARKATLDDEVIVAPAGYLVLKQCWHDPEGSTNAVKVSALIRQNLEAQQFQKQLPDYLEKLRKDAGLEILDEKLKPDTSAAPAGRSASEPADKPKAK